MNQNNNNPQFDEPNRPSFDDLKLENELLKLKMQAELGAIFGSFSDGPDMPPEIEREFLEQVLAFERMHADLKPVLVREHLGYPEFKSAVELDLAGLEAEWERVQSLYQAKELGVDFLAEYPVATKYDFMAVELLNEMVEPIPGRRFIYEEFHPNHDRDQRRRTQDFMDEFFGGIFDADTMSAEILTDDGRTIRLPEAQALLDRFHDLFASIESWRYVIVETSAQTDAELPSPACSETPRLGFTEGLLQYTVRAEQGERRTIEGPFKLYMECSFGWWSVMHFLLSGFSWEGVPEDVS
jgi:hypothetical protein